jgi:hypothetical protein
MPTINYKLKYQLYTDRHKKRLIMISLIGEVGVRLRMITTDKPLQV